MKTKLLLIVFVMTALTSRALPANTDVLYNEAHNALVRHDYDRCISACSAALRQRSRYSAIFYAFRGFAYEKKDNLKQALSDCNAAVRLDPRLAMAYDHRGTVYYTLGRPQEALDDYNQAIRLDPKNGVNYYNRANLKLAQREEEAAIRDYDEAIRLHPRYADAYGNRGAAYSRLRGSGKALADYNAEISLRPKDAYAYYNRGACYADIMGEFDRAIRDFTESIRLDPNGLSAYVGRSNSYKKKEDLEHAVSDAQRAIGLKPKEAIDFTNRGVAYNFLGEYQLAMKDFAEAIRRFPLDETILSEEGWLLATCPDDSFRDGGKALALSRKACEMDKWRSGSFIDTLAAAYAENGEFDRAIESEKRALAMNQGTSKERQKMQRCLELYQRHKPFRQQPKTL